MEPEIKYFKNNNAITILKLITTDLNNKKDNNWHRIIINNINEYLKKNMLICVVGKIKTRKWLNLKNEYNYITEIFADEVKIINHNYKKNNNGYINEENLNKKEKEENLENTIFENNEIENNDGEIYNKNEDYKYNYSTSEEENI